MSLHSSVYNSGHNNTLVVTRHYRRLSPSDTLIQIIDPYWYHLVIPCRKYGTILSV